MTAEIHYLFVHQAFGPEAIDILCDAMDRTCAVLGIATDDRHRREAVAVRLLGLARNGVRAADVLRDAFLAEVRVAV